MIKTRTLDGERGTAAGCAGGVVHGDAVRARQRRARQHHLQRQQTVVVLWTPEKGLFEMWLNLFE